MNLIVCKIDLKRIHNNYTLQFTMATELITNFDTWNVSNVRFGAPKTNSRGGKSIKIMNEKNNTLILNTPLMLTWGINKIVDDQTNRTSYNLSIQYQDEQYATESQKLFFKQMKEFEEKLLETAISNCKEWFNKSKVSREVVEALYTPILKYPNIKGTTEPDYTRMPTTRIKIPYWDNKFNTELYGPNKKALYMPGDELGERNFEDFIPKKSHIASVMQCNGVWFIGGKFGVSFQMVQCIVQPPVRIQGSCFVNLVEEDRKRLDILASAKEEEEAVDDVKVDDSDDEEEEDVVEEVVEEVVKAEVQEELQEEVPKKKGRRKKAVQKESEA